MATIALDRRFIEWDEGELSDPEVIHRFGRSAKLPNWETILKRRRVVILAEAGSGKTTEMKEQARLHQAAGKFAVYATVEDVGRDGLDDALGIQDRIALATWRTSGQDGWFFIDSVDEAKRHNVRLERTIRRIADGIVGAERNAHVILSGRLTDWEFRRDLKRLSEGLPIPNDPSLPPPPTGDELLISTLRHERRQDPPPPAEQPLVVLMAPLDEPRVKSFAAQNGVPSLTKFLAQIGSANLWRFARRPLDLDWLVEFWRTHRRLGSLAEMLEHSLAARVRERNLDRSREDSLDDTRAVRAIERVGAALVFCRKETISIPDSEVVLSDNEHPLDLDQVLPDWSPNDRMGLLARPVFDPATLGRARLHNDNEGVVRGYLTARWLHRLRQTNLSRDQLFDLLFARAYGIDVIKPTMQETAAWLAIWDEDVGREVSRRDPSLLIAAGDPASLPASVRESVLTDVVTRLVAGSEPMRLLMRDSVQRFARPDLGDTVRRLWLAHHTEPEARDLLLRIIWLGELGDCADLAVDSAFGTYTDRHTGIVAGRAIVAVGDDSTKRRYARFIKDHCATLPVTLVWDAIEGLFPEFLDIEYLLDILDAIDVAETGGGLGFEWLGPKLVDRLDNWNDLERLLRGLLDRLGRGPIEIGHIPNKREDAYFAAIAATACRLLGMCATDEAPTDTIDAALELGMRRRYGRSIHDIPSIAAELHRSTARRRIAFWRASERLTGNSLFLGRPLQHPHEMEFLGYSPDLRLSDVEWLLTDGPQRPLARERCLAINSAMRLWRDADKPDDLLTQIRSAAGTEQALLIMIDYWVSPPPPSPEMQDQQQRFAEMQRHVDQQHAARDKSWIEFVESLRKDPGQLRHLRPVTQQGVDSRLYHLWRLLSDTVDASTRYAIDSIGPIEPMIGQEAATALRDALIEHWRHWEPRLKSARASSERNQINSLDCMGITGVTLEARMQPHWAERLSSDEARRAASYATLEINGLPSWITKLAASKPAEVRCILVSEAIAECSGTEARIRYEVLDDISRADKSVIELVAPSLFEELQQRRLLAPEALESILGIVAQGLRDDRDRLTSLAISRFNETDDIRIGALYLGAAFAVDPAAAAAALSAKLDRSQRSVQKSLVEHVLPILFGTGFRSDVPSLALDFATLERLVTIAFRTVRAEEDNRRESGVAFAPDVRDNAEHARGAAFNQLMQTPGKATYEALLRFMSYPECPVPKQRLYELARDRAAQDSESAPWHAGDALAFERTAETAPSTPKDLQRVAMRRLADVQHDLLHSDFAQGRTVKSLPDETAVQNWVADRLRLKQGRSFSVEREVHVVDEKEPDIRLRAKASDASLPIEVKIAESWTVQQLEAALVDQLCGRYLRARDGRYGILLLVHQKPHKWRDTAARKSMDFGEVIERLRALAADLSGKTSDAPQPEIAMLDVSHIEVKPKGRSVSKRSSEKDKIRMVSSGASRTARHSRGSRQG